CHTLADAERQSENARPYSGELDNCCHSPFEFCRMNYSQPVPGMCCESPAATTTTSPGQMTWRLRAAAQARTPVLQQIATRAVPAGTCSPAATSSTLMRTA